MPLPHIHLLFESFALLRVFVFVQAAPAPSGGHGFSSANFSNKLEMLNISSHSIQTAAVSFSAFFCPHFHEELFPIYGP
jgi:hypothetical protein